MKIGETGAEGLMGTPPTRACVLSMQRPREQTERRGLQEAGFREQFTSAQFKSGCGAHACERVFCATVVTSQLTRG
jgi:hypothetical protein